ncbi:hypothetical protein [Nostoc sp.]|uniref:hypothetical protein n=1 Tax=Nostoc sp. TaxID=1180 RepID=UPI002FF4C2C7
MNLSHRLTYADVNDLIQQDVDFKSVTQIEQSIERFVQWYRDYYEIPTTTDI